MGILLFEGVGFLISFSKVRHGLMQGLVCVRGREGVREGEREICSVNYVHSATLCYLPSRYIMLHSVTR